ncbi:MAG TPA: glycosyltransferase [Terriglobales bacterium]
MSQDHIEELRRELAQAEERYFLLQKRAAEAELRQAHELEQLRMKLDSVQRAAREARAENDTLAFYLNRYNRIRDKFLPPGSRRLALCRKFGLPILARAGAIQKRAATRPDRSAVALAPGVVQAPDAETVLPPQEWNDDPLSPPVVIAIPNWNRRELLERCIESIFSNTHYERFRICVYEQGSTDGSRDYLESLQGKIDGILSPANVGFVDANNAMIRRYPGWDVVFLNNDTEVTDGWLDVLVTTAYRAGNIGLVGAKLIYDDGRLQEAGSQVFQDGSARAYGRYEDAWHPEYNQVREVDYCSAACLYAKRKVLDAIGGFDRRYAPAYYEDTDLAFAARTAGFKVLVEPRSVVIHREYSTSGGTAFDRMETNRAKFAEKWHSALVRHPRSIWEVTSFDAREKVLVIDDIVPAPDRSSGGTRLYELLRLLARHYHVVFAYIASNQIQEYVKPLERLGITVLYPGYAKALHRSELDMKSILLHNDFKYIFFELFSTAEKYLSLVREYSPDTALIIDTYDVHFVREARESAITNDGTLQLKAAETKQRELGVYRRADMVLTVTEEDKNALTRELSHIPIEVIPNIHSLPDHCVPRDHRRDLMFVGGFTHTPNIDAVLYFCRDILPLVLHQLPDIKFYVVGNAPPPEIVALSSRHVVVTGYVPSLIPYLESMLISVAPLRFGAGMKGKIGEAMAYGLPVVSTSIGAEGMNLYDGIEVLIADSPPEFASKILQLYDNPELWYELSRNGRRRVEREWSPATVNDRLISLLRNFQASPAHSEFQS